MLRLTAGSLRQAWLQHVVFPALPLCRHQHTSVDQDANESDQIRHREGRNPISTPEYLEMGFGNRAFSLYFDKLRRNHARYYAPRHPMQVPFDKKYSLELELMRRHNTLLPNIEGQTIACKVMAVDKYRNMLWFDTGHKYHAKFRTHKLKLEDVVATKDGPIGPDSPTKLEWEVGDVMHFVVKDVATPFNEMDLEPVSRHRSSHSMHEVMKELELKHATQEVVMGRVLNEMQRGYAVGIAGVVAFCPLNACSPMTARRIGVLQPFYVKSMPGDGQQMVVLEDAKIARTIRRVSAPPRWGQPSPLMGFPRPGVSKPYTST